MSGASGLRPHDHSSAGQGGTGVTPSEIVDIPTAETNGTLVLAPDGTGGVAFRAETGGAGVDISDNAANIAGVNFVDGSDPSSPAASHHVIYAKTGGIYVKNPAGTVVGPFSAGGSGDVATDVIWDAAGDLAVGTGANTAAKLSAGATSGHVLTSNGSGAAPSWQATGSAVDDATISTTDITTNNAATTKHGWLKKLSNVSSEYMSGTGVWSTPAGGGGSAEDPIADKFGTPDTAYDFGTSSLTGLTALSPTPDVEDANTTVPGAYYLNDNAAGVSIVGRYAAVTAPFTAITKVLDATMRSDYNYAGMFCGIATPGKLVYIALRNANRSTIVYTFTGPTDGSPGAPGLTNDLATSLAAWPAYFAIRANSNTSIDYLFSYNGRVWIPILLAHDNSMTVASVGPAMMSLNANGHSVAWDYLRIWNSALTMPGT